MRRVVVSATCGLPAVGVEFGAKQERAPVRGDQTFGRYEVCCQEGEMSVSGTDSSTCGAPFRVNESHRCGAVCLPGTDRCLAHTDDQTRSAYLAGLAPRADIDMRGVPFTHELLGGLLDASLDPHNHNRLSFGTAHFDGAAFPEDTRFDQATFTGEASFDRATFGQGTSFRGWPSPETPASTERRSPETPASAG
jgi:Pentapeptide repeats (9 copies)